ncbi:alpha/beta hydrolase [Nonomuraea sp. NPDC050691]|uniref:alpha/beta hydrolase n=1 Tax=Nonomuraea sp. NPDC050691 TaxID=3155661 RepID=UPI003402A813
MRALEQQLTSAGRTWEDAGSTLARLLTGAGADPSPAHVIGQAGAWTAGRPADIARRRHQLQLQLTQSGSAALATFGLPPVPTMGEAEGRRLTSGLNAVLDRTGNTDPATRAAAVRRYFGTLTTGECSWLATHQAELVGNLDGAPVTLRYAANRLRIADALEVEQAHLATMMPTDPTYQRQADRVEALRGFLVPHLRRIWDPMSKEMLEIGTFRQFLLFDPRGDGRLAEVTGDLENADDVAIQVPGITNRLDNFSAIAADARQLVIDPRTRRLAPGAAVVSWLGYDTPELGDAVDPAKALVGGRQLAEFRAGIGVCLKPTAKTNLFAHSYGTLVSSKALQNGAAFDTITFMGSPGLGSNVNSVADFRLPAGTKVYDLRAPGDWVSYTQGHGKDPADFADIIRLDAGDSSGHSQYYKLNSSSLENLRAILFRRPQELTFTGTHLDDELAGAMEARAFIAWMRSQVPAEKVLKLGVDMDPIIQDVLAGRVRTPAEWSGAVQRAKAVFTQHRISEDVTLTELDAELGKLAREVAAKQGGFLAGNRVESAVHLTTWLLSQMPPEKTAAFGVELAGILGDKSLETPETAIKVIRLVNDYDVLDHITPTELQSGLVAASAKRTFRSSYEGFRAAGLSEAQAFAQATTAATAAGAAVYTTTTPVIVALGFQRGIDNIADLGGIGTKDKAK